jgi:hypothetical protein
VAPDRQGECCVKVWAVPGPVCCVLSAIRISDT